MDDLILEIIRLSIAAFKLSYPFKRYSGYLVLTWFTYERPAFIVKSKQGSRGRDIPPLIPYMSQLI